MTMTDAHAARPTQSRRSARASSMSATWASIFGSDDTEVVAVSDVSLNVKPGEFVSLIGPSGCGKSTLLSIVAGFMKPTRGEAMLDGKPITRPGSDRGVVFQQYSLFPWLSVRKNVEFGLKMAGVDRYKRAPPRARCSISRGCCRSRTIIPTSFPAA